MNTLLLFLSFAVVSLLVLAFLWHLPRSRSRTGLLLGCNAYGKTRTRQATLNRTLDAAVTQRFLLATHGATPTGAAICTATTRPIGYIGDEGGIGDPCVIEHGADKTFLGIAAVAIAIDDDLYTTPAGKVTNVAVNDSFKVGVAISAVSAGQATAGGDSAIVEYLPQGFGEQQEVT